MKGILLRAVNSKNPVELIYMDRGDQISQRIIRVLAINDHAVKAYCYTRRQFRTFRIDNILSVGPLRKRVGA